MSISSGASWNIPPPTYDARSPSTSYMTTTLTPYLTLPHLLSLTWLAYPILSLIFVAFRLQLSLADAQSAVVSAKGDLLTSCKAAEQAATSAASMPRFMALATNKQYADAVNASMNAARAALVLALTVMEAIINFIVDLYRSTFLCFLELVIRGGLAILIGAVQEINNVLQSVTSSLRTGIQSDIASANNVITTAINAINKVNPFGNITPPQITVPSLDSLQNISLPASFEQALTNINASIPSVADIKDKVDSVIDTPFELLKKDINDTFAGISFDPEGLPVPELNQLSFCNDLDTSVIDDIGRDFVKTAKIGVVILILLALLLIGFNCLLTWYKWRCMKNHLEYTRQAWMTDPTIVHTKSISTTSPQVTLSDHNLLMLQANSEHPLITRIMNVLSAHFRLTPAQHTHIQWFLHYIFYPPALACFLIGFFGLLSVQVQLLAVGTLEHKYQARAAATVTDFSTIIATTINQSMYNQSSLYANDVNGRVDTIQSTINDGVFGWVNGTTTTLNNTINEFYTDIQNAVTTVFGGTILESPANDFLACFLGGKVDAIESALTFLHDNLNVDIPRVNQSVLVLSPESVNEAAQPIAAAAIGGGSGDDQGLIGRLVNSYAASLKKERVMFGVFMALWGVVVLMGLGVVLYHSFGRPYLEKRGRRRWEAEQRDEKITSYRSFSPLPSPRGSAFKPFWSSRSNSPENHASSAASSQETLGQSNNSDRPWETAFAAPVNAQAAPAPAVAQKKTGGAKLLAIGRKAMLRGERLKKDGSDEEIQAPLEPPAVASSHNPSTAWYSKMTAFLSRTETDDQKDNQKNVDFWDQSAMKQETQERGRPKPKLQIYTQRGLEKYGPPPRQSQQWEQQRAQVGSRWSITPDATKTTYMSIMTPTKKFTYLAPSSASATVVQTPTVVVSPPASHSPSYSAFPYPPIGVPIRSRQQNTDVPLDVGSSYDDPFMASPGPASILPIPLHNGFDSLQTQAQAPQQARAYPSPPRHPQLQTAFGHRRRQDSSPPPPLKSPRMFQPQVALAPPPTPQDRHRRTSSMGTTSQWRVTNAAPGDSAASSVASLKLTTSATTNGNEITETSVTPVTRLLTTTHARQSSSVNPFITPFDDEHRVTIDHPTGMAARKSMQTNPFAHAI
ncbi:hypothetical protein BDZ97DRAFT_1936005 [Flammula alnicola]|nr:hypothetical protein BDZ97DRAFT_1936005 [Flammula alnicola]